MNKFQKQVEEFHDKFNLWRDISPDFPPLLERELRYRLMREELDEFIEASESDNLSQTIKELCDLVYVVMGTAVAYGIDLEPYFDEVHRSNMTKLWEDGTAHFDEGGKVLKPPTYSKADIGKILLKELSGLYGLPDLTKKNSVLGLFNIELDDDEHNGHTEAAL